MNFHEAQIHALIIQAEAIKVEVISMQAHDQSAAAEGTGPYTEEAYLEQSRSLNVISNEIQTIARQGYLS